MLFQILKDGRGMMSTTSAKCVPSRALLLEMQRAGFSFRLDGKAATVQKVIKVITDN